MTTESLSGGCLCGAVRYRIARVPDDVGHCHCRICQRAAGAPVVTWATLARGDVAIEGAPAWYRSTAVARRGFCPACGTQLFFAFDAGDEMDVTVASLDDPDRLEPTHNGWVGSRRAFMKGFDAALPDHEGEAPKPG